MNEIDKDWKWYVGLMSIAFGVALFLIIIEVIKVI